MREIIDGAAFTEMLLCASDALEANKQQINELNVFPVPDGDTGTNMSLTMGAGASELRKQRPQSVTGVADCAANALLRGARGNSGVILSLLFRGISRSLKGKEAMGAIDFAEALGEGVEAAYKAVMKPAEGTVLTVSRMAAASAMEFAKAGSDIELMLVCALESARDALAETVHQNPVLERAGVVDAGGTGFVVILEAMLASLQGRAVSTVPVPEAAAGKPREGADFAVFSTEEITFAFDTVFIVRRTIDKPLDGLRAYLSSIGDSLVIGESDEAFKVHVHTDTPGDALNEAQKYGTLEVCKIENMRIQHDDLVAGRTAITADALDEDDHPERAGGQEGQQRRIAPAEKPYGVVAVCAGEGLSALFRELGADAIVTGGQTMNPSTEDILRAVDATPAETVFVLPNNKNIVMAAEQCIPLSEGKKVVVIPTKTVPQGITALLSLDTYDQEEEIVAAMTQAMEGVHTAQVTYAARDSEFDGHSIKAGEYLALLDGGLVGSYTDTEPMLSALVEKLKALDPELITVYYGEDVSQEAAEAVGEQLTAEFPDAEINVISGGQPVYYYMIAAE